MSQAEQMFMFSFFSLAVEEGMMGGEKFPAKKEPSPHSPCFLTLEKYCTELLAH